MCNKNNCNSYCKSTTNFIMPKKYGMDFYNLIIFDPPQNCKFFKVVNQYLELNILYF